MLEIKFREDGLVPVVVQDVSTQEVLMVAYANQEAVEQTMRTGYANYFSTIRRRLWFKGEASGNAQEISKISMNCHGDAILYRVFQKGAACHTGNRSCFFKQLT